MGKIVNDTSGFPDNTTLSNHLETVFSNKTGFNLVSREVAAREGTFAAEILKCSFQDNSDISVRCKYSFGKENNQEGGHRGGVTYESKIYEELLHGLNLPLARYYGNFSIPDSGLFCMVLEYLKGSMRVTQVPDTSIIFDAAEWIGFFHSNFENITNSSIKQYDQNYYLQWSNNVENIGQGLGIDFWINPVCSYYAKNLHYLLESPQTLIHGEFYPNNILYKDGRIFPVDWESAALAPGEVDLASLVEGWGDDFSSKLVARYLQARFQKSNSINIGEFMQRLNVAKLYLIFRWIGRYPNIAVWKSKPDKYQILPKSLAKLKKFSYALGIL